MTVPANYHFVILNLFQDNERQCVVLKQVQHDETLSEELN